MIEHAGDLKIISGGARGADRLAHIYAQENKLEEHICWPDWEKHGKAAGFIRNREIVDASDEILAFWDGKSRGTANTIAIAKRQHKTVIIIEYENISMGKN